MPTQRRITKGRSKEQGDESSEIHRQINLSEAVSLLGTAVVAVDPHSYGPLTRG